MSDIRWIQRLNNFKKAFKRLDLGLEQATNKALSELEKEGLIQRFEYTQELSSLQEFSLSAFVFCSFRNSLKSFSFSGFVLPKFLSKLS
jgi:hypothetical protein